MKKILALIPKYARLPLVMCLLTDITAFYLPRVLGVEGRHDLSLKIDALIPVVPAFAYVYVAAFAFWTVNYILICRQSKALTQRLFFADTFAKLVCLVCFFAVPCYIVQPANEEIVGVGAWLMKIVYAMDEPNNLLPSIHCFLSWLSFRPLLTGDAKGVPMWYKVFSGVFSTLICLSTLFTRQHVFLDWVTGFTAAEIGWQLYPAAKRMFAARKG